MRLKELKFEISKNKYGMGEFAELLGLSRSTLFRKINGITEFKLVEIQQIKELLKLSDERTIQIFFDD